MCLCFLVQALSGVSKTKLRAKIFSWFLVEILLSDYKFMRLKR